MPLFDPLRSEYFLGMTTAEDPIYKELRELDKTLDQMFSKGRDETNDINNRHSMEYDEYASNNTFEMDPTSPYESASLRRDNSWIYED